MAAHQAVELLDSDTAARRLEPFVGRWSTTGAMVATGARFTASDTYEWVAGSRFLLHRWDAQMPEGRREGVELIGYDAARGDFAMHSFDSSGRVTIMRAICSGEEWRFVGESLRFAGSFAADRHTFSGQWDVREADGQWVPLMRVALERIE